MEPAPLCELCGCEPAASFHHLIPRTTHRNKWFKKRFTRDEFQTGLQLCKTCHKTAHRVIPDEKELGRNYNTREKLLEHPLIARYVAWKQRRQGGGNAK